MSLLEILRGEKPLLRSTRRAQFLADVEQGFAKFLNSNTEQNYHYVPDGSYEAMQAAVEKAYEPSTPIDPTKIPANSVLQVFSGNGPAIAGGDSAIIFTVPLTQHFLLTYAFMATNNGGPPALGSGMDFVPLNFSQAKQTFGDNPASNSHLEGIYIIQPINEQQSWAGNQVSIFRNPPVMIPAGSVIRIVRSNTSTVNTIFGKVAGYLINIDGSDTNPPPKPPPQGGPYALPGKSQ